MAPLSGREVSRRLAALDPTMATLVGRHGPMPTRRPVPVRDRFATLARAVAYQQLAGRAAASIWARVESVLDGAVTPDRVRAVGTAPLKAAGLSAAKARTIGALADAVRHGDLALDRLGRCDDDAVVAELTAVWGIGPWTAHMFLLSALGRLDVWPTGDLGVRTGFARAYGLATVPTPAELEERGEVFRPYRSAAAWYCWRVVDTVVPG